MSDTREVSSHLHDVVLEAVSQAHPNGDMEPMVERILDIIKSVDANARAYGVVLGRRDALASVVEHLVSTKTMTSVLREIAELNERLEAGR